MLGGERNSQFGAGKHPAPGAGARNQKRYLSTGSAGANAQCETDYAEGAQELPGAVGAGDPKLPAELPEHTHIQKNSERPKDFSSGPAAKISIRKPGLSRGGGVDDKSGTAPSRLAARLVSGVSFADGPCENISGF